MPTTEIVFIVTLVLYLAITRWKRRREDSIIPEPEPKQPEWRDYSPIELQEFNGIHHSLVFLAIKGTVYNVTMGSKFYGPKGPYSAFGGRDATRGLAKSSFDDEFIPNAEADDLDDWSDLNDDEKQTLDDWKAFFDQKYPAVGRLISNKEAAEARAKAENVVSEKTQKN